ncbi:DNA polymerase III, beta chain, partial [human gut metagenome]
MINQTNYAVSLLDTKPILTGELFDIENGGFNMVAIDGFRLAIR